MHQPPQRYLQHPARDPDKTAPQLFWRLFDSLPDVDDSADPLPPGKGLVIALLLGPVCLVVAFLVARTLGMAWAPSLAIAVVSQLVCAALVLARVWLAVLISNRSSKSRSRRGDRSGF